MDDELQQQEAPDIAGENIERGRGREGEEAKQLHKRADMERKRLGTAEKEEIVKLEFSINLLLFCCTAKFAGRFFYPKKQIRRHVERQTEREQCSTLINFLQHVKESKEKPTEKLGTEWLGFSISLFV